MGDMKTPDFDDLLAAFDIPDMVDPKAAIESGHDDHESQLKPQGGGSVLQEYEAHVPSSAPSVSVIVKNVRTVDAGEHEVPADKEDHTHSVAMDSRLHSVLLSAVSPTDRYRKNNEKQSRDQGGCKLAASNLSSLNQFSPISSAEEFDDDDKIEVDDPMDRLAHRACLKREEQIPKPKLSDSSPRAVLNGDVEPFQTDANNNHSNNKDRVLSLTAHTHKPRKIDVKAPSAKLHQGQELKEAREPTAQGSLPPLSQAKGKSSNKLSSCIAAIAALSAKKASSTLDPGASNTAATQREPVMPRKDSPKGAKESSPRAAEKPQEPESALEVAKRLLSKPPDSPSSVISEGSVKGSPDSPSTPVIPKVRIQTIKTSSGQIKRTVTRVLPELDSEGTKTGEDAATATTASVAVPATLSSPTSTSSVFTSPAPPALPTTVVATSGGPTAEVSKPMTIKPVATAFLPVSAVKTAGSQIINLKLANNTTVKATVIPAASVQSASCAILKAANAIQQQAIMVPASNLANAKVVPKTVHLTNLNLLPHAATMASEIHQALAAKQPQRQGKQQATAGSQAPKKVSRVQVLASSQSSVVEAFNKVLSGINPVPVYIPDLSPPSAACIALPSRGYKCLECGDSFALERSLAQHYDRRSVRIEVTCNHCSKNLVFYNKCSLLSHARGHKDKGVVMQCSHLILKPIPADQMITTSPPPACSTMTTSSSSSASSTLQAQASKSQSLGRGTSSGVPAAVISAPSSAPMVAAMPLEEDVTRLCRSSLKCLECSEVFQDEPSLAMHYQKAQDSNGQKTCTICQMMLPNQCSFLSHQRIHQHKSPYICPECGASCRSVHFQSHVTRNCLHYTRRVGYRCVHCSVIYADIAALKSHIQGSHCEVFYKCPICPMAFKSAAGTHSHALTQHPGVKIGDPKLIYKCSMCDTVFTQQTLLYSHFDQHLVSQKVSVFKCPDCSMHYAQKQLMMDHIKAMHGTLKTIEGPPNLGINLPLSTKATNPMSASPNNKDAGGVNGLDKKPPASPHKKPNNKATPEPKKGADPEYRCADCDRLFTSREVFVGHVRREHGKQLKKHPCRLCEKSFSSSHSLCRHNRLKHKGLRKVYTCPHCPGPSPQFTKRLLLDQHMQQKHGIKTTVDSASAKASSDNDSSQALSPKRKQEDEGPPAPRPRDSDSQPLKKQKVNVLKVHKCAVCSFTSEDVGTFREHIPQHKTDGSSFQCRECGFCFTSHPSLARHLFIVHRLKEPHGLNRRGGRGDDDESQRENQLGPAGVNADGTPDTQCKVCGKMFETEGSLNTHMRTHGMAFIKSKRLSSAEK